MLSLISPVLWLFLVQDIVSATPTVISPQSDGSTSVSVAEDIALNTAVFTVQPYDSSWTYTLIHPPGLTVPFQIDAKNGIVETNGKLDFEKGPSTHSYIIHIRVSDRTPSYVDRILTIHITNVYDVAPSITVSPGTVHIPEEMAPDTTLPVSITVTDPETAYGDEMTFSLIGADSIYFKIHPQTGSIHIMRRIDYDAGVTSLTFRVKVTDKGGNTATGTVSVYIDNINDNSPTCSPDSIRTTLKQSGAAGWFQINIWSILQVVLSVVNGF